MNLSLAERHRLYLVCLWVTLGSLTAYVITYVVLAVTNPDAAARLLGAPAAILPVLGSIVGAVASWLARVNSTPATVEQPSDATASGVIPFRDEMRHIPGIPGDGERGNL